MSIPRKLSILTLASGLVAGGALGLAGPASAVDTTVTFEVTADTLDITAPVSADLGSGGPGSAISGQLGSVQVDDGRASADASWTASATSTDLTTGTGEASETVLASETTYQSGPATATTGTGTFTPGQFTSGDAEPLDTVTPVTSFTHTGGTGNNSAAWNPNVTINVPTDNVAGTYTGTITHSVA